MHKGESEVHAFHFHLISTRPLPHVAPRSSSSFKTTPAQAQAQAQICHAMPAPVHRSRSHFLRVFAIKEVTGNGGGVSESTTGTPLL